MRDRLPDMAVSSSVGNSTIAYQTAKNPKQEAISALCALGYKPQDANKMVQNISQDNKSCEQIIKLALQGVSTK
jgi:Holliday junction DNA helicase RuvA